jgi:cyanophycin synthetase
VHHGASARRRAAPWSCCCRSGRHLLEGERHELLGALDACRSPPATGSPAAIENLLAALAAAWSLGLSAASLRTGAETFDPPVPATAAA